MEPPSPQAPIRLSASERKTLEGWSSKPGTSQALAMRARFVLACAKGRSNSTVGDALGVSTPTVAKWRGRFLADRVEGLRDARRSGAPRRIKVEDLEWVLTLTLLAKPAEDAH